MTCLYVTCFYSGLMFFLQVGLGLRRASLEPEHRCQISNRHLGRQLRLRRRQRTIAEARPVRFSRILASRMVGTNNIKRAQEADVESSGTVSTRKDGPLRL